MLSAKLVLKRAWAQLVAETLAYKPYAPDKRDGTPPKRTRQYLFPTLFLGTGLSQQVVSPDGNLDDLQARLVVDTVARIKTTLSMSVGWHQEMVAYYHGLRQTSEGLFIGGDPEAKLLRIAFDTAKLHGDLPAGPQRERIVRARVEGQRHRAELTAGEVGGVLTRNRAEYQLRLDTLWLSETINAPATLDRGVKRQLDELTGEFSSAGQDVPNLRDEQRADLLWQLLVENPAVDSYRAPYRLQLTDNQPIEKPELQREPKSGLPDDQRRALDRSIRRRITRLITGERGLLATAEEAVDAVLAASPLSLGLAQPASRVALILGTHLAFSLTVERQLSDNPAAEAMHRSWMRSGRMNSIKSQSEMHYDKARNFAEGGAAGYYIARLWGRLLRAEIVDAPPQSALAAWSELLRATMSTREHVVSIIPKVSSISDGDADKDTAPPRCPTDVDLVMSIIEFGSESRADVGRFARRLLAYAPPFEDDEAFVDDHRNWNDWSRCFASSRADDEKIPLDDLPSFGEAIMIVQRFAAEN